MIYMIIKMSWLEANRLWVPSNYQAYTDEDLCNANLTILSERSQNDPNTYFRKEIVGLN